MTIRAYRLTAPLVAASILVFGAARVNAQSSAPTTPAAPPPAAPAPMLSSVPPTAAITALYSKENAAVAGRNYAQFIASGTPAFKKTLTKELFTTACANISANLKSGYTSKYVGQRPVQDNTAYFWDLTCKNGVVYRVILGILGGKVSACLYHIGPIGIAEPVH